MNILIHVINDGMSVGQQSRAGMLVERTKRPPERLLINRLNIMDANEA